MNNLENLVSVKISPKELAAALEKLEEANAILKPYLIALTPEKRQELPKMSDGNAPFVDKVLQYAQANPAFTPNFVDVAELKVDTQAVTNLSQLYRQAEKLCTGLNDTIMMSGSEAYRAALVFYKSVKTAASMNVPGARPIYEDLKKRFDKQGKNNTSADAIEE